MLNISQLLTPQEQLKYLKKELKDIDEHIERLGDERIDVLREIKKLENNLKK